LNLFNNIIIQRELVYKYFNITDNIHDILTGRATFTAIFLVNRIETILRYNQYKHRSDTSQV